MKFFWPVYVDTFPLFSSFVIPFTRPSPVFLQASFTYFSKLFTRISSFPHFPYISKPLSRISPSLFSVFPSALHQLPTMNKGSFVLHGMERNLRMPPPPGLLTHIDICESRMKHLKIGIKSNLSWKERFNKLTMLTFLANMLDFHGWENPLISSRHIFYLFSVKPTTLKICLLYTSCIFLPSKTLQITNK